MIGASLLVLVLALDGTLGLLDGALLFGLLLAYTGFLVVQSRRASREAQAEFDAGRSPAEPLPAPGTRACRYNSHSSRQGWHCWCWARTGWCRQRFSSPNRWGERPGDRPDHCGGGHIDARGGHVHHGGPQRQAGHCRGQRGGQQRLQSAGLSGPVGRTGGAAAGQPGLTVAPSLLALDVWVMLAVALACLPIFLSGREIARWEGALFLGYYVAYMAYVVLAAQQLFTRDWGRSRRS